MNRKLLSVLVLFSMLFIPATVFGAEAATVTITQEEQQQINKTIANLEQEIKALRERVGKVESAKEKVKATDKTDFKFWGDSRTRWINKHDDALRPFQERIRFGMSKEITDQVQMNIRLMMGDNTAFGSGNGVSDTSTKAADLNKDTVRVIEANFVHKGLFDTNAVTIGRFSQTYSNYWVQANGGIDGIKVSFGGKSPLQFNASYANWNVLTQNYIRNAYSLDANYKVDKNTMLRAMYVKEVSNNTATDKKMFDVRGVGITTDLIGDFYFKGDYIKNIAMTKGIGYYYSLGYKEADRKIPHSWGLNLEYRKIEANNHVTSSTNSPLDVTNAKGPSFAVHYVPAKNVLINAYQTFNTKFADTGLEKPNYSRFEVIYNW